MYYSRNQSPTCRQVKSLWHFTVKTEYWPSIFPFHRYQIWDSTHCTIVFKQKRIPITIWCVNKTSLGNPLILKTQTSFVWSRDFICSMYNYAAHTTSWPSNVKKVIFSFYFKKLRSFSSEHNIWSSRCRCIFN